MQGSVPESWLPDWLPSLSSATVDVDGEPPYAFHLDADAALEAAHHDAWIESEGRMETTPEGFGSTGSLAFRPPEPRGGGAEHEVTVERDGELHRLTGHHVYPADGVWRSRDTAERAAVNAVEGLADSVGVDADVELRSYSRDDERVDLSYEAELEGVDQGVTETLYRWFGSQRDVDEAEVEVQRISVESSSGGGETSYSWDVDVDGHLSLATSLADAAGWSRATEVAEVRRESGFGVDARWSIYLGDDAELSLEYDAANGRRYVDALESAGFDAPPESEIRVEVESGGGRRSTEVRYETQGVGTDRASLEDPERWLVVAPAPLLPVLSYYLSR